jgi:hypothetical protein
MATTIRTSPLRNDQSQHASRPTHHYTPHPQGPATEAQTPPGQPKTVTEPDPAKPANASQANAKKNKPRGPESIRTRIGTTVHATPYRTPAPMYLPRIGGAFAWAAGTTHDLLTTPEQPGHNTPATGGSAATAPAPVARRLVLLLRNARGGSLPLSRDLASAPGRAPSHKPLLGAKGQSQEPTNHHKPRLLRSASPASPVTSKL